MRRAVLLARLTSRTLAMTWWRDFDWISVGLAAIMLAALWTYPAPSWKGLLILACGLGLQVRGVIYGMVRARRWYAKEDR
jgi:hypothetical protein